MLFLVWYDADNQRSISDKIQAALDAYVRRFSLTPNVVLISANDTATFAGVEVRSVRSVQPNNFWVGHTAEVGEVATDVADGRREQALPTT